MREAEAASHVQDKEGGEKRKQIIYGAKPELELISGPRAIGSPSAATAL